MKNSVAAALLFCSSVSLAQDNTFAPDVAEPGSVDSIRRYTTAPEFLPATVSYVPESATVPSPGDVLGHIAGAPNELTRVAKIYDYYSRLAASTPRVRFSTVGKTEEGRDLALVTISDEANLQNLDRFKEITRSLADPRRTSRADADRLAAEGKTIYHLIG